MNLWKCLRTPVLGSALALSACAAWCQDVLPVAPAGAARGSKASRSVAAADALIAGLGRDAQDPLLGVSGAVGQGGRIIYAGAAGFADLNTARTATPRTRYRVYSSAKPIGAAAAMMLAEAGQLDLDAPVSRYLPQLPARVGVVTARQLLAHRSGVRHYRDGEWNRVSARRCAGPGEALVDFIDDPLEFAPGAGYQYSTFGYVLLSAVLEAAAGQPLEVLLRERVFRAAGMKATAIEGRQLPADELATFYERAATGDLVPVTGVDASCKFLGGGLVSTAEDLVRFGLALLDGKLVSPASLAQMLTVHAEGGGSHPPYGYGFIPGASTLSAVFNVPAADALPAWWHGGNGRGGYSVLIIYPEHHAAAALTTNIRASGRLVRATHELALPFLRELGPMRVPPKRAVNGEPCDALSMDGACR